MLLAKLVVQNSIQISIGSCNWRYGSGQLAGRHGNHRQEVVQQSLTNPAGLAHGYLKIRKNQMTAAIIRATGIRSFSRRANLRSCFLSSRHILINYPSFRPGNHFGCLNEMIIALATVFAYGVLVRFLYQYPLGTLAGPRMILWSPRMILDRMIISALRSRSGRLLLFANG